MRDRKWTGDEEIDAMLNDHTANTGEMAKASRIMQHRTIEAMNGLHDGLQGVMTTIHRGAGLVVQKADDIAKLAAQKADEVAKKMDDFASKVDDFAKKVGDVGKKVEDASNVQTVQQRKIVVLTVVITVATVVYAAVNIFAASEMRQANAIQRDMVAATNRAAEAAIAANAIQRDMVAATNKAAQAAIAANEIQRQALENPRQTAKQPENPHPVTKRK
jgi:hypothetical protein